MDIKYIRETVGISYRDASKMTGKSVQQIRTLEKQTPETLTLDDVAVLTQMFNLDTETVIKTFVLKDDTQEWPKHPVKFWELHESTYLISPLATWRKLHNLDDTSLVPSLPTLYRLSRLADLGYNELPVKLLWQVNELNKGVLR